MSYCRQRDYEQQYDCDRWEQALMISRVESPAADGVQVLVAQLLAVSTDPAFGALFQEGVPRCEYSRLIRAKSTRAWGQT